MTTRTALATWIAVVPLWAAALPAGRAHRASVDPGVEATLRALPPSAQMTVIVRMQGQADLRGLDGLPRAERRAGVIGALRARSEADQAGLRTRLRQHETQGAVSRFEPFWILNGLSVTASPAVIRELAARADVAAITPDDLALVPSGVPAGPPEWNVAAIQAPELWALGFLGQGAVIAILDSGVDVTHPDLAPRFRGGAGGWFDPYGQHASPYDRTGHGTWVAGAAVGGDAGGTTIGIAPQATFIAARIWADNGSATATAIHRVFQWVLDPDGNGSTADAPDVVNASWAYGTPGCNLEFQADLRALRGAGIVPVFAAGNFGPGSGTSVSPANYPEALSVGALDAGGAVAFDSGRGPSACGGATYPSVVAPGVEVRTSDLYALYTVVSGTSLAAPQVSGALAVLLGAHPVASGAQAEAALLQTARDLGIAGADNDFGRGMIDAVAAHQALAKAPPPPPVAADDAFTVAGDVATAVPAPGVLANDQDPSGRTLSAALVTPPIHGTISLDASGGFTYAPVPGYAGVDSFTYAPSAGGQLGAAATATISVRSTAPVAAPESYVLAENAVLAVGAPGVLGNDSDPSGRALSAVLAGGPAHGTVSLSANGSFTYVPAPSWYGADAFTYRATNGASTSAPATVSLSITFVNQPPVARDDAATTTKGIAVNVPVLANDTDVDGSIAVGTVSIASAPRSGSVSRKTNGTVTYAPNRTFRGTDSFRYTVKDDHGATSNAATVTVQVR
ncbi:MAG: Ig-like domain-containing protein [Anaeromyxobacteraceae bacterium]